MGGETLNFDVHYMIARFKERIKENQKTVLVLGARAGALFRSDKLYDTLKLYGNPSFADLPRTEQFSECYRILNRQFDRLDIDDLLTDVLAKSSISQADIYLAALVRQGLFDVIISTNVDGIFEQALEYVGMEEQDFVIYSPQDTAKQNQDHPNKKRSWRIIKAFGQLALRDYSIKRNAYQNKYIESLLSKELKRDILAIGLDSVWDGEIYRAFPPQSSNVFWYINEDVLNEDSPLYQTARARDVKQLTGEEYNYDDFVKALYWEYIEMMPGNLVLHGVVLHEMRQLREEIRDLREKIRTLTQ